MSELISVTGRAGRQKAINCLPRRWHQRDREQSSRGRRMFERSCSGTLRRRCSQRDHRKMHWVQIVRYVVSHGSKETSESPLGESPRNALENAQTRIFLIVCHHIPSHHIALSSLLFSHLLSVLPFSPPLPFSAGFPLLLGRGNEI